jgi:ABC-type uncharacterized transport system ATPase component
MDRLSALTLALAQLFLTQPAILLLRAGTAALAPRTPKSMR